MLLILSVCTLVEVCDAKHGERNVRALWFQVWCEDSIVHETSEITSVYRHFRILHFRKNVSMC